MKEEIFWIGHEVVSFRHRVVWIVHKSGPGAGRSDIFCSTNEGKVHCRRDNPMTEIVRVISETALNCTGVAETTAVFMWVEEMPSVCTGVEETPPDCNRVAGTPQLVQKKCIGLMNTSEKDTLEILGSYLASPFYKYATWLCGIGKDVTRYFLKTPRGVILPPNVTAHFDSG